MSLNLNDTDKMTFNPNDRGSFNTNDTISPDQSNKMSISSNEQRARTLSFRTALQNSRMSAFTERRSVSMSLTADSKNPFPITPPSLNKFAARAPGANRGTKREDKVFSNKVYVPWYRRYYSYVPEDVRVEQQPFKETISEGFTEHKKRERETLRKKHKKKTSVEERELDMYQKQQLAKRTEETVAIQPITDYLSWVRKKRITSRPDYRKLQGKWLKIFTPAMKIKIKQLAVEMRRQKARQRFIKIVNVVLCLRTFFNNMKEAYSASDLKLGDISTHAEKIKEMSFNKNRVFDPFKYKISSKMEEGAKVPFRVKMILTKPWYTRTLAEVEEVVECLYGLFIFVKFPINVARQISRVAWYIKLGKSRPILRQSDVAMSFCFLLSGIAKVTTTATDIFGRPFEIVHRKITRGQIFGEDDLAKIDAVRNVSVTTITSSEIMTIDYADYQQSLLNQLGSARVPRHIKVVKRIPFIKPIALMEVLANALDCFQCLFFPCNTIIVESMRNSDFVFIVLHGECYRAKMLSQPVSPKNEDRKLLTVTGEDMVGQMKRESLTYSNRHSVFGSGQRNSDELKRQLFYTKLNQIKAEFGADLMSKCETSLVKSKEDLIKEIKPKQLLGHIIGGEQASLHERWISEDVAKKMKTYEEGNEEYKSTLKRTERKTEYLKRVLARFEKTQKSVTPKVLHFDVSKVSTTSLSSTDETSSQLPSETGGENEIINEEESDQTSGLKVKKEEELIENTQTQRHTITSLDTIIESHAGGRVSFKDIDEHKGSRQSLHKEGNNSLESAKKTSTDRERATSSPSALRFSIEDSSTTGSEGSEDKKQSFSLKNSHPSLKRSSSAKAASKSNSFKFVIGYEKSSVRGGSYLDPMSAKKVKSSNMLLASESKAALHTGRSSPTGPYDFRRYKKVGIFRKNQLIGNEYVDYNDGTYREQIKDFALVSGGVEMVMVAKWFLLQHLYHHW